MWYANMFSAESVPYKLRLLQVKARKGRYQQGLLQLEPTSTTVYRCLSLQGR